MSDTPLTDALLYAPAELLTRLQAAEARIAELEAALRNLVETDFAGGDAWVRAKLLLRKKP